MTLAQLAPLTVSVARRISGGEWRYVLSTCNTSWWAGAPLPHKETLFRTRVDA